MNSFQAQGFSRANRNQNSADLQCRMVGPEFLADIRYLGQGNAIKLNSTLEILVSIRYVIKFLGPVLKLKLAHCFALELSPIHSCEGIKHNRISSAAYRTPKFKLAK